MNEILKLTAEFCRLAQEAGVSDKDTGADKYKSTDPAADNAQVSQIFSMLNVEQTEKRLDFVKDLLLLDKGKA